MSKEAVAWLQRIRKVKGSNSKFKDLRCLKVFKNVSVIVRLWKQKLYNVELEFDEENGLINMFKFMKIQSEKCAAQQCNVGGGGGGRTGR